MDINEIVSARELGREYESVVAVDDVRFSVPQGAVMALVGPNGAGKTTLLKMLAAVLEPTRGTALVNGLDILKDPRGVHATVGFLPDFFGLYDSLSVEEYLEYFSRAYRIGNGRRGAVIARALEDVGLPDKKEARIGALSRGMRQRLGIARTLLHDPPLLLLDEPASGLDPELRHGLQKLFQRLAAAGKTLVVSSHILTELEDYCTHVAIMFNGRFAACGGLDEVRASICKARKIRVRPLGGHERALEVLRASRGASGPGRDGDSVFFGFSGGDEELAGIMKRLSDEGVRVAFFGEVGGGIQDAYLASLEREAQ